MKNRYIKSLLFSAALGGFLTFSACDSFLDIENDSVLNQGAVFSSVSNTHSALTGVYNMLPGDNGYGSRISTLFPNAADDFRVSGDHNPQSRTGIAHFSVAPGNPDIEAPFNQLYRGIERANICIKNIPLSEVYTNGSAEEQALMRKFLGEALTLRAQYYHELIRNWGDVPAQFEPSSDIPDLFIEKTNQDVIYDRLLADLAQAATLVPWRSESGDPTTRVTKGAVKALRARIALARGGYALRRESKMMERRSNYREFYEIARNETRDIIQKGDHRLNPVYENVFRTIHGGTRVDPTFELIWEVGAFGGNARTDTKLGYGNGPRINAANTTYGQANGLIEAVPTYFYEFDSIGDARRDVTIAYFQVEANNNKTLTTPLVMREGKFRKYWTTIAGTNQTLGINWPLIRYADVLLMFAEAENELNGPTPQAIDALQQVRKRAFVGYEARMGTIPTTKEGFFNTIVKERLLEFGGEGIRKYDLYRWKLLGPVILETRAKMQQMMTRTGRYANVPQYVYFKPNVLQGRGVTAREEMMNFDLLAGLGANGTPISGNVNQVMYKPSPTTATVTGYTRVNWAAAITEAHYNTSFVDPAGGVGGALRAFGSQFKENKSELFPIPTAALNSNFRLSQDFGN
ncbi:RagB/SusD family nutrient uptake outer membrane protein [Rufibacter glacialis]|uniref:RagB/SusD family nutrient uptake outer membrane protein n=1 Tax=Rufibacter glacialis TaxID=1259555 RepID=A0A5M8Q6V9_9BACT|nr:RagB/SusD family nutrient uptake outer membrane protein [Rufibacter glacialis]KAA6430664.1 RagB/SusD family nutrient uptake outer membrane protein [Rufibacter glacialis]GGK85590.1 starch-binding protein [Rufibacter glacialis]